ncbi:hypothetical protein LCGC14_0209690 [marine sediment metagenome]|uniref:Uncharacterized protein n=1 Tax=marine sediment metagenome TaxID=412755 RepID=A0A0F9XK75_9ZZZZ
MKQGVRRTCKPSLPDGWWLDGLDMAMMTLKSDGSALGIVFNEEVSFRTGIGYGFTEFEGLLGVTPEKAEKIEMVVNVTLDSIYRS